MMTRFPADQIADRLTRVLNEAAGRGLRVTKLKVSQIEALTLIFDSGVSDYRWPPPGSVLTFQGVQLEISPDFWPPNGTPAAVVSR